MITLKTLPQATEQEVFDQASNHLLTQKKFCGIVMDNGQRLCFYRHKQLMCVAGCFIGEDEYSHRMERKTWINLAQAEYVPKEHANLIRLLQRIHDLHNPEDWKTELQNLASSQGLTWNF